MSKAKHRYLVTIPWAGGNSGQIIERDTPIHPALLANVKELPENSTLTNGDGAVSAAKDAAVKIIDEANAKLKQAEADSKNILDDAKDAAVKIIDEAKVAALALLDEAKIEAGKLIDDAGKAPPAPPKPPK